MEPLAAHLPRSQPARRQPPSVAPKHTTWSPVMFSPRHKDRPRPDRCSVSSNPSRKPAELGPVPLPTCSPSGGCGVNPDEEALVPSYRRRRTGNPPHQARLIIRKQPKRLLFAFIMS